MFPAPYGSYVYLCYVQYSWVHTILGATGTCTFYMTSAYKNIISFYFDTYIWVTSKRHHLEGKGKRLWILLFV